MILVCVAIFRDFGGKFERTRKPIFVVDGVSGQERHTRIFTRMSVRLTRSDLIPVSAPTKNLQINAAEHHCERSLQPPSSHCTVLVKRLPTSTPPQ
jgi:hypothetical protein